MPGGSWCGPSSCPRGRSGLSGAYPAAFSPAPPNGTIFDRFQSHGISWRNYYTDLPSAGIIATPDGVQSSYGVGDEIMRFNHQAERSWVCVHSGT